MRISLGVVWWKPGRDATGQRTTPFCGAARPVVLSILLGGRAGGKARPSSTERGSAGQEGCQEPIVRSSRIVLSVPDTLLDGSDTFLALPEPLGPSRPKTSPGATVRSSRSRARRGRSPSSAGRCGVTSEDGPRAEKEIATKALCTRRGRVGRKAVDPRAARLG